MGVSIAIYEYISNRDAENMPVIKKILESLNFIT